MAWVYADYVYADYVYAKLYSANERLSRQDSKVRSRNIWEMGPIPLDSLAQ